MLRTLRAFWQDQRGIALILVAIMLPVLIGFSVLVIDMSRASTLHNDLQKAADAMAVAGAAELDGRTDSITRADRAIASLVDNQYFFAGTSGPQTLAAVTGITRRYLRSIPGDLSGVSGDARPVTDVITDEIADADEARFVEVTANPVGFTAIFPLSVVSAAGGPQTFNVGAVAVAGFTSSVCNFTPVFICNPYEGAPNGITLEQAVANRDIRRRLIELRKVGNGAAAGPGNFGFLEPPDGVGNGAQALAQTIATSTPVGCYSADGVDTKTGQNAGPVQDAFNVRFGIRANGSHFNDAVYGPAENVRKGGIRTNGNANSCPSMNQLSFTEPGTMGLPRDATTPYMSGRMGDGNWDLNSYWSTNFPSVAMPSSWSTSKPTRYEVYRYEIAQGLVGNESIGGERGTPASACQPPVTTVDRRLIYGAILNCNALEEDNDLSGHSEDLPVEAFASFFLTEPVQSPSEDASVMVELLDITGRGGQGTLDNFLRDEAQLYR